MPFFVQIDDREVAGPIPALLKESPDFRVAVTRLKLGDYLFDNRFLFERKTLQDLVISIISDRLFTQASRLAASSFRPAIILEGTARDLAENGMTWESIQGALVTLTVFYGIPILRTRTPAQTVRTMLFTAQQGSACALGAHPRPGYRPRGKHARQLFILQGLPGIGPTRARQLLARFGNVAAVMQASAKELQAVQGVGKKRADSIRWAVEESSPKYI